MQQSWLHRLSVGVRAGQGGQCRNRHAKRNGSIRLQRGASFPDRDYKILHSETSSGDYHQTSLIVHTVNISLDSWVGGSQKKPIFGVPGPRRRGLKCVPHGVGVRKEF